MSTLALSGTGGSSRPVAQTGLSARKFRTSLSRPHAVWREPFSRRELDALFVREVLPGLTRALERQFIDWFEADREDAVQDCVCQTLEVWRRLGIPWSRHRAEIPSVLAAHVSGRYFSGVRFAQPRQPAG
jgi:hypothetical protein